VANAGGLTDVVHEGLDYSPSHVLKDCDAIYDTNLRVLREAERYGVVVSTTADRMAETRVCSRQYSPTAHAADGLRC
jgi:glutamate dehydrogenase/leucine dehydrogenase